jgi:hypothetical protein
MAVDLEHVVDWEAATGDMAAMLDSLQPNIIKPHIRDRLTVLS